MDQKENNIKENIEEEINFEECNIEDNEIEENEIEENDENDVLIDDIASLKEKEDAKKEDDKKKPEKTKLLKIKEDLKAETNKYEATLDKLKRTLAEYDNYKKRTQREKCALYEEAVSCIISSFLPILDSIDSATLNSTNTNSESLNDGLMLLQKQIDEVLQKMGIEIIEAKGEYFDPELHNAVMHVEDEKCDDNVIVEVFQKGYKYNNRIIRHSMVKVAN